MVPVGQRDENIHVCERVRPSDPANAPDHSIARIKALNCASQTWFFGSQAIGFSASQTTWFSASQPTGPRDDRTTSRSLGRRPTRAGGGIYNFSVTPGFPSSCEVLCEVLPFCAKFTSLVLTSCLAVTLALLPHVALLKQHDGSRLFLRRISRSSNSARQGMLSSPCAGTPFVAAMQHNLAAILLGRLFDRLSSRDWRRSRGRTISVSFVCDPLWDVPTMQPPLCDVAPALMRLCARPTTCLLRSQSRLRGANRRSNAGSVARFRIQDH